jgi:hypothetical protein
MYKVDSTLFEKFKSRLQTRSNNNDPNPLAYITRNRTPITTQRFWEKRRVTSTVGTRSSIAVRRPEGSLTGDMIFVAQVEDGNAVIRKAETMLSLSDMVFTHVTTINNVSELSIMFDGYMKMVEGKVESYTTGELPIVFYVDSSNSLKGWNMNTDITFTISDTAYNVASVRGLYSEAANLDDGVFVFYTNASGELWEARVLNDEVIELTQIILKPEGVTGWVDVWATLTFDYRVSLQLEGNDGNVYSLLSASRPSGFALVDYISWNLKLSEKPMMQCGLLPPTIISASNSTIEHKIVLLIFDDPIYLFDDNPYRIWVEGGDSTRIYPESVTQVGPSSIILSFGDDLYGLPREHVLKNNQYQPCGFGSIDGVSADIHGYPVQLFGIDLTDAGEEFLYWNLSITEVPYMEIDKAFDGKCYTPDETITHNVYLSSNPTLDFLDLVFVKGYNQNETINYNLQISTPPSLIFLNVDGTPV